MGLSLFNRRRLIRASGPLIGAVIAIAPYAPFIAPNNHVIGAGDYSYYQQPIREFAREELLAGRLPLWCSYLCCGAPVHATQQAGLAYLPVTLAVVLFGANAGLKISVFLHVLLCYVGQYRLTRLYGMSQAASVFSAIVTCQSGFVVFHLLEGHLNIALEYAYLPWFFFTLARFLRKPAASTSMALAAIVAILALTGQPQLLYYCLLIGGIMGLGSLLWGTASFHRIPVVAWGASAAMVAILISGIQTIPTLELIRDGYKASDRGTVGYASSYGASSLDSLTFVWPYFMGNRYAGVKDFSRSPGYVHERTNYLGLAVPLLLLIGLAKKTEPWQWPMVGLTLFCLVIGIGSNTPLFTILGQIPGFFSFRCPARTLAIVGVLVPILAARGLDSWINHMPWEKGARFFAAVGLSWFAGSVVIDSVMALVGIGDPYAEYLGQVYSSLATALVLACLTIAVVLSLPRIARWNRSIAYLLLIGFAAADLWITTARHIRLDPPQAAGELPDAAAGDPDIRIVDAPKFPEFEEFNLRYSSIVPIAIANRWTSVMTNEGGVKPESTRQMHEAIYFNTLPALRVAACDWLWRGGPWERFPDSLPRARFIPREFQDLALTPIEKVSDEQVAELRSVSMPIKIISDTHGTIALQVDAPSDGIVVLADTFYPGWKCFMDGRELDIQVAHGAFRGVNVSPGKSRLTFSYQPISFKIGSAMTLMGVVAAGVLLVVGRRAAPDSERKV